MKRYLTFDKKLNLKIVPPFVRKKLDSKFNGKNPLVNISNIGYYIITPLLVGVFLGIVIDRWLRLKNIFTLSFIFLGMVAAFYNLYKIYKNG